MTKLCLKGEKGECFLWHIKSWLKDKRRFVVKLFLFLLQGLQGGSAVEIKLEVVAALKRDMIVRY